MKQNIEEVETYNVIKGFLNVVISSAYWIEVLNDVAKEDKYGYAKEPSGKTYMIEYSSPNTNKPLHLGHIRNNFLGWSVSEIQKANGHKVIMANLVNDRGIHICKSMIAWEKFANGSYSGKHGNQGGSFRGGLLRAF